MSATDPKNDTLNEGMLTLPAQLSETADKAYLRFRKHISGRI